MTDFSHITGYIKSLYPEMNPVLLHCPQFLGNEKKYLNECIDTKFVSYVSHFVTDMEEKIKQITGAKYAVAMVNGTEALRMAFVSIDRNGGGGLLTDCDIITQSVTFAATASAIVHAGANPVFIDIDRDTMGMSPASLRAFLGENTTLKDGACVNKISGNRIAAVVPMHTFGHPCRIDEIKAICDEYSLVLIEDSAESLGSFYKGRHTGTFGAAGVLSFNGNKTVTTGGGGMLITDDAEIAERARYLSTTAKKPSSYRFYHTEAGWNLRMPGVNAAIGCAQLEYFDGIIADKRETATMYQKFFSELGIPCIKEPTESRANYWLNAILLKDVEEKEAFLKYTNTNGVQTRPLWTLMHTLPPYQKCWRDGMENSEWLESRLVNIPSSVRRRVLS